MKKLYKLLGVIAIVAVIAIGLAGCDNGSTDDSSSGSNNNNNNTGGGTGIGTITISGIKAGLNGAKIVHSSVNGTNDGLNSYRLVGGVLSGSTFDNTGSATISNGSVSIPVRGSNGTAYTFTDGLYTVTLTISGADSAGDDGAYPGIKVNFSGSSGTAAGNTANGLGINP